MKKERKISSGIRFDESQSEYTVEIKERKKYWWLLLLLLLIPLFINLEKDITVCVLDRNEQPVNAAKVDYTFVASHLYKQGKFFVNDTLSGRKSERTDNNGVCVFKDCPYSIYGMIFKMFHRSRINVSSYCIKPLEHGQFYYYTFGKQTLYVEREIVDVIVKVLDSEDGEPINEATVHYRYQDGDKTVTDSAKTNAAGYIVLKGTDRCGKIDYLRGSCYGYKDDSKTNINVIDCVRDPAATNLLLKPIKESITFFVTNCNSLQPLSGARATVTVSNPQKSKIYDVSTNTDGRGRAVWDGFHILSKINITASKQGFKDGALKTKYTVEQFVKLPDSQRTICLEPNPCTMTFANVDSLTQEGIKGVRNEITVTSATRTLSLTEFSGNNGIFYVEVLEGDELNIAAYKSPDYHPAQKQFKTPLLQKNIIPMMPRDTLLKFRVLDANKRFHVQTVADVHLKCFQKGLLLGDSIFAQNKTTSITEYYIRIFYPYEVSIEARAAGYKDNDYQISNVPVRDLLADASKCDILLEPLPVVCTGKTFKENNDTYLLKEYDMSGYLGEFLLVYDTYSADDTIIIYDAAKNSRNDSNKIFNYKGSSKGKLQTTLKFKSPVITVEVFGDSAAWDYEISCPKQ
jgi:hypothetical protein